MNESKRLNSSKKLTRFAPFVTVVATPSSRLDGQRQGFAEKEYYPAKQLVAIATPNGVEIVSQQTFMQAGANAKAQALAMPVQP